jgi:type I restriction enzyme M protein
MPPSACAGCCWKAATCTRCWTYRRSVLRGGRENSRSLFEKGAPTQKVWFYQLNLDRNLGKTNPLNEADLTEFLELQKTKADSENSWTVNVADVDTTTYDLSVKNPNKKDEAVLREPTEILDEIQRLDEESAEILNKVRELL